MNINSKYLFDIKKNGEKDQRKVPLDSHPEEIISSSIIYSLNKIKLWAKNQTTGTIYGEYNDTNGYIRKSYFDFIIKFENDFYLYIEVKGHGESDINPEKTKNLKTAYEDYFNPKKQFQRDLLDKKLVICLAEVDTTKNIIHPEWFYDKELIKIEPAKTFEEVLKYIENKEK